MRPGDFVTVLAVGADCDNGKCMVLHKEFAIGWTWAEYLRKVG